MKFRDIEKKIYELLGVNIFRKYVLFTYDKLFKPIGGAPGYRIKNITIKGIEEYKFQAKVFGYSHFGVLICMIVLYYFHIISKGALIIELILNPYCIMTQRYTCIRINDILEKHKELEKIKEEKKVEVLDCNLSPTIQFEQVEKKEQMASSKKIYYWEPIERLEQTDANFDDGFTRALRK